MPDPNKIEGGRWDRVLRSKFNLKGYGSTAARISDDISPTFNFPFELEDQFLLEEKLLVAEGSSGPTAAQNPRVIVTNVSDNSLLILEKIIFTGTVGGNPYFGFTSAIVPFIAAIPVFTRDGRWGPLQTNVGAGNARFQSGTLVGAPTPRIVRFSNASIDNVFFPNLVLAPGDSAFMTNATVATFLIATFFWREHTMEPSEGA